VRQDKNLGIAAKAAKESAIAALGPRRGFERANRQRAEGQAMITTPDNDNNFDGPMIFIIIGKGYESDASEGIDLHIMLKAPDDDTAVREALNALAEEGFIEADLDQIGMLTEVPAEEPHASAYQGAVEGEVAIIRFN
jgi:hypothetical protein